jgi:branched-subunit amino acid transport protein AzlD
VKKDEKIVRKKLYDTVPFNVLGCLTVCCFRESQSSLEDVLEDVLKAGVLTQ